jgi:hypothetical protein
MDKTGFDDETKKITEKLSPEATSIALEFFGEVFEVR